jgi:hypothetical protein
VTVVHPPIQADLACLVERTHDQPNPDGQQLDVGERDLDVAADEQPLVEDPVEDLDEAGRPGAAFSI